MTQSYAQKVSATIPFHLIGFIKEYKHEHHLRSDSEVISLALKALEKAHLEACYAQSAKDLEKNAALKEEALLWDKTIDDGIDPEDW